MAENYIYIIKIIYEHSNFRSSHQRCSVKKGVLKNFTKFTGKHLYRSFFLIKMVNFAKSLGKHFFTEHLRANASITCKLLKSDATEIAKLLKSVEIYTTMP